MIREYIVRSDHNVLSKKNIKNSENDRYFLKTAIQYIADRVLFVVVIDCGTLWSFSCRTWMPLYVDIFKRKLSTVYLWEI